jgi:hypothetical protein
VFNDIPERRLERRRTRSVAVWSATLLVLTSLAGCTALDWIEKKTPPETPGEMEARLERIKKQGSLGQRGSSVLHATPLSVDFGGTIVGSAKVQTIVLANPTGFTVTILFLSVEGDGFTSNQAAPIDVPAGGHVALTATFRPPDERSYSRRLLLEIDTAGERFTQVPLTGRGIRKKLQASGPAPFSDHRAKLSCE